MGKCEHRGNIVLLVMLRLCVRSSSKLFPREWGAGAQALTMLLECQELEPFLLSWAFPGNAGNHVADAIPLHSPPSLRDAPRLLRLLGRPRILQQRLARPDEEAPAW